MATFKQKLENFWYHYKWQTVIGVLSMIVLILLVVQCATTSTSALKVMYTGPVRVEGEARESVEKAFGYLWQSKHPEDSEGVALASIFLMSSKQLEDLGRLETVAGDPTALASLMATERQKFFSFVGTGECLIYLLDPAWYEELKAGDRLVDWGTSLGYQPEGALDDCSILFWDTEFAKSFGKSFEMIPKDTVLCMLKLPDLNFKGGKKEAERYAQQLELFCAMVEFSVN